MGDIKNKTVNIYIDQSSAVSALEKLQATADKLNKKIDEGRQAGKAMVAEIKKLAETQDAIKGVQAQIDNGLRPSLVQAQNQVTKLRNELKHMSEDAPGHAEKFKAYEIAVIEFNRISAAMNNVGKAQKSWLEEAKVIAFGVLIGNTVQSAIGAIGGYFSGIISGNAMMSDSLAKVRQTTGLTAEEVQNLASSLRKIDTRTAQSELLKIAEIGGQFNVPKEQLKGFVEQIDKVNVVLGSEFGGGAEQITTEMALLRNVFVDIKSDNIAQDIGNISNAVITLAQEGAATAPVISDFSKRLSPLISTAKLTSGEILGLSATMQELAVNPERGGTAVVKLFDKMISNATAFAKVAGVGVEDFKKKLQTDSFGAFLQVLEGFKKGGDNVLALNETIKDLETSGVGAKEVLVKLSGGVDLLKNRTDLGTEALLKQTKVTEQFAISNNNLGGETDKLSKKLESLIQSKTLSEFFANGVHAIIGFIDVLKAVPAFIKNNETAFVLLAIGVATMNASYIKAGVLIARDTVLRLYNAVVTKGSAAATELAGAAQAAYATIVELVTGRITLATAATRLWSIALALGAGPIGVLIIAAGALVLIIGNLIGAFETVTAEQKLFGEVQAKAAEDVSAQRASIDTLTNAINNNALSLDDRKKALNALIAINPAYLSGLTLENIRTAEGKKIIDDYIVSLDRMARAKATQSLKEDLYKKQVEASVKAQQAAQNAPTSALGIGLQSGLVASGFGAFTGLQKGISAKEDVTKAQEDINALNVVNQKQITEENKLIDAQQQKMKGLKTDSIEYKNEQVKLNDLVAVRNVLLGIETTALKTGNASLNNDITISAGLIDALKAKIKALDDALGGLRSKSEITDNRAERKKLQDQLDALEGTNAAKKATKENNERDKLLKELKDFQFELTQIGKQASESEIERIGKKYDELIKRAAKYGIDYINLEKERDRAVAYLIDQEEKKRQAAIKKMSQLAAEESYKNFQDAAGTEGENQKDVAEKKYGDGLINKRELAEAIKRIDIETLQFEIGIAQSFAGVSKQAGDDVLKYKKKLTKEEIADLVATREHKIELEKREALAAAQVGVLKTPEGSKARLDAQLNLLKVEHDNELKNVELTNSEKDKLNEEFRQKQLEVTVQFYIGQVQQYLQFLSQGTDIISKLNDSKNAKENAALQKELKNNEIRKNSIKSLENSKVISTQEARRRITNIEKEEDAKKAALEKKQFERNKKLQITQAFINGALGITSILAAIPGPLDILSLGVTRYIAIGLNLLTTAAAIKTIADQKFAEGGQVKNLQNGKVNTARNIPTQPNGDDVLATVKVGEVLLNEHQQHALGGDDTFRSIGVPGFARGGTIKPFWERRPYKSIDYPAVAKSMQVVKFAQGGLVQAGNGQAAVAAPAVTDPALTEMLQRQQDINESLVNSVNNLNSQLAAGINSTISLRQLDTARSQQDRIKKDAEFK